MSALTLITRFTSGVRVEGDRGGLAWDGIDAGIGTAPSTLLYGIDLRSTHRGRHLRHAAHERLALLDERLSSGPDYRRVLVVVSVACARDAEYARPRLEAAAETVLQSAERRRGHSIALAVVVCPVSLDAATVRSHLCDAATGIPDGACAALWDDVRAEGLRRALVRQHL
ncbi:MULTISPECIES: hypothetical protein [Microbacterium]|uniref:Uncharacterized protein n=1 Tax=Microbacterium algihabitans TaxID=3075992 RepID=A0ABU3RTH7_9MICO|nr:MULTISPECIES: hypothetical protein [Microbacterium]MDU0326218.1 hypothetical protein [Microbacterium sp. KSW2-21]